LFPNKELEGLMGLFEDKNDAKTTTTTEENNDDDPAVKRIEENVKELEYATNKAISQMSLVKYRSHWENLIIAMEDRISSASLQSLSALSVMINKNPSDSKIVTVMEKLNSFDIALVSCGGYANPICAHMYLKGKSAIYVGGVLQMYFGILGNRWIKERPDIIKLYHNKYWKRPKPSEKPKNCEKVEGACYW
jgi:hypothetical protein